MSKSICTLAAFVIVAQLGGCSSAPPQRHEYSLLLDALPTVSTVTTEKTETLNIQSVDLPAFLQTRALAMQVADNEVVMARHHAWADRLDNSIATVLGLLITAQRPQLMTVSKASAECQLHVRFDRFHAAAEGEVLSSGQYTLDVDGDVISREFDVSRELPVGGYANAVTALRLSLDDLAGQIDNAISTAGGCVYTERPTEQLSDE